MPRPAPSGAAGPRDRRTRIRPGRKPRHPAGVLRVAAGGHAGVPADRQSRGGRGGGGGSLLSGLMARRATACDSRPHERHAPARAQGDHPSRRQAGDDSPRAGGRCPAGQRLPGPPLAQRKLDQLRRKSAPLDGGNEAREQIVALSREWSLLSPYTAFLVLENDQQYAQWNINRSNGGATGTPPIAGGPRGLRGSGSTWSSRNGSGSKSWPKRTALRGCCATPVRRWTTATRSWPMALLDSERKSDLARGSAEYGVLSKKAMAAAVRDAAGVAGIGAGLVRSGGPQRAGPDRAGRERTDRRGL